MNVPVSFILLISLIIPLSGPYILLDLQKIAVRHEIRQQIAARLPKSELRFFRFAKESRTAGVNWVEEGEFETGGKMYDVVFREEGADSVSYWCFEDQGESQIKIRLKMLVNQESENSPGQRAQTRQITSFFSTLFTPEAPDLNYFTGGGGESCVEASPRYKSVIIPSKVPPP